MSSHISDKRRQQIRESQQRRREKLKDVSVKNCLWCTKCDTFRPIKEFHLGYKTCDRHHEKPKPKPVCSVDALLGNPPAEKNPMKLEPEKRSPKRGKPKGTKKMVYLSFRSKWMIDHGLNPKTDKTPSQVKVAWDAYKSS